MATITLGTSGNDFLYGDVDSADLDDYIQGLDGDDVIFGFSGNNILDGGDGNDFMSVLLGVNTVIGGAGLDGMEVDYTGATAGIQMTLAANGVDGQITAGSNRVTFTGIEQFFIAGTDFDDVLLGGQSNDVLFAGNSGNDQLRGGAGDDVLYAYWSSGASTLNGGLGDDSLTAYGSSGSNTLLGAEGNDYLTAEVSSGNSTLRGGAGDDVLSVNLSTGNNYLEGGAGNDVLQAEFGEGSNTLLGGNGDDVLTGISAGGSNTLNGGNNNDVLYSGSSQSLMIGGTGDDVLSLGADDGVADTVQYKAGDGLDRLYDFVRGLGGDSLVFSQIADIDVVTNGANTSFHLGDGIDGNAGFGSGQVLAVVENVTDFSVGDVGVNLFGSDFFFA